MINNDQSLPPNFSCLFDIDYDQGVPPIVTLNESAVEESFKEGNNAGGTKSKYTTGEEIYDH